MDLAEQNKQKYKYQKRNKVVSPTGLSNYIGPKQRGEAWVIKERLADTCEKQSDT